MSNGAIVITGAASGIGAATARRFGTSKNRLVLADVDAEGLSSVSDRIIAEGGLTENVVCDVSDADSVSRLMSTAVSRWGGVRGIVNVAGIQRAADLVDLSESDWDLQMAVNVKSCFLTAKFGVPLLMKAESPWIVSVASITAHKAFRGMTGYSASKGAIVSLMRSLAVELAPLGVRVNCVSPGWVETPFNRAVTEHLGGSKALQELVQATVPLGRQAQPDDIAALIQFLGSADAAYITGQCIVADGGVGS